MKTFLRLTAFSMAAALSGAIACTGTANGGGCGGMNTNTTANNVPIPITCGPGTVQQGTTCVPTSPVH